MGRQRAAADREAEERLQEEVRGLRCELLEAVKARTAADRNSTDQLQDKLAAVSWSFDESEREVHRLEAWHEGCLRKAERQRESFRQTERRLNTVVASRVQDAQLAKEEERDMIKRHREAVEMLSQQLDSEA